MSHHSHTKRDSVDARADFIDFPKNVENSDVVVYWRVRSFKMASNGEELLAGDGTEEILRVKQGRIQKIFGDAIFWNGNFSLPIPWLPGGKKITSF